MSTLVQRKSKAFLLSFVVGVLIPLVVGWLTVTYDVFFPILVIALCFSVFFLLAVFQKPIFSAFLFICFGFFLTTIGREIGGFNYGILPECLLVLTWFSALYHYKKEHWARIRNDVNLLMLLWFVISVLEVFNPTANFAGAIRELRTVALYPLLVVPLFFVVVDKVRSVDVFIIAIIAFSLIAALNGVKQKHIGLFPGEQQFLDEGGDITHIVFSRLRVFSFYSDAGQFGASQAHIGLIALILAFGPYKLWKRILLFSAAAMMFYGMLISGTRGSLSVIIVGVFFALLLSKNYKAIGVGTVLFIGLLGVLKFTYIGNGNYDIYRLRTALDPEDASLNVRLHSQRVLRNYLRDKPFGDGLGTIGYFGMEYNKGTFLSSVQPDSYWVKVWAMYGIVGLTLWFSMMMYILGKCCGIVWRIQNKGLKVKLLALTAGYAGILVSSYGNEVINNQPSSFVIYLSWVLVLLGPRWDKELKNDNQFDGKPSGNS
ncbi:O-antigen ligase family protein [Parapedobacter sp. DT-150]|uniref:O-antigen ligase family protein n=1 Tax=Parapedobacter sp. DT-150 TaxID=3396162 RepID=UPI003F1C1F3A